MTPCITPRTTIELWGGLQYWARALCSGSSRMPVMWPPLWQSLLPKFVIAAMLQPILTPKVHLLVFCVDTTMCRYSNFDIILPLIFVVLPILPNSSKSTTFIQVFILLGISNFEFRSPFIANPTTVIQEIMFKQQQKVTKIRSFSLIWDLTSQICIMLSFDLQNGRKT